MLLYNSMLPDRDLMDEGHLELQNLITGELLSLITTNHYRNVVHCLEQLEADKIFLGNGTFIVCRVVLEPDDAFTPENKEQLRPLVSAAASVISAPLYYCYTCSGHVYFLLCFPRITEGGGGPENPLVQQAIGWFTEILAQTKHTLPHLHFLLGDLFPGERSIYLAANSLNHAHEYFEFRENMPPLVYLETERQLHGSFIERFDAYQKLASFASDILTQEECDTRQLSDNIVDQILSRCALSMESVHHHVQIFMLTFTNYLNNTGIVNSDYIERKHINHRIMRQVETEAQLRARLAELLLELRKQYLTLSAVGKKNRILAVKDYVETHISDTNLSVAQISDQFQIFSSQLTKQFQQYFGITLYKYIQNHRLALAKQLMWQDPDRPLQEIAHDCGYVSLSTMYRAFKKIDGSTPGSFRSFLQKGSVLEGSDNGEKQL